MNGHSLPKVIVVGAAACLLAAACAFFQIYGPSIYGQSRAVVTAAAEPAPAYAANGDMLPVPNYREWIYLSSGLGMDYSPQPGGMTMFDNVFVNPEAYRSFVATGTWPDKTVMVLESRGAESKGSINQSGHYQSTSVMGFAIHVKDEARFPGKWAFFSFNSPNGNGTLIPQGASCYSCHAAHGAVDTSFVQFYPTLLSIAHDKKTLSDAFLKDEAAQAGTSK
jgi:Cytochrome P460